MGSASRNKLHIRIDYDVPPTVHIQEIITGFILA
jgi:hypothetical protein